MSGPMKILRLDASANPGESDSRKLGDYLIERLEHYPDGIEIHSRDLNQGLSFIDGNWIGANFTPAQDRSEIQLDRLHLSDTLIAELKWADHIVLTTPMYNFGIPATLKAWIDLVCRAGVSFRYGADGPEGLIGGKSLDIVITTGGAPLASPVDFVSGYLKQVFNFIGINEINIIGADQMNVDAQTSYSNAISQIKQTHTAVAAQEVK